jgi:hypothetical protein
MSTHALTSDFAGVRLTRRGRLVLLVAFLAVAFGMLSALGDGSAATGDQGEPVRTTVVEVHEGDTLWGIASSVAEPEDDVRDVMGVIRELNALPTSGLSEGQVLAVPAA